jgi:hypothetical protein
MTDDEKLTFLTGALEPALAAAEEQEEIYQRELQRAAKNHETLLGQCEDI